MDTAPVITLTTDFGLKDPYVGVMKGVIAALNPLARIIDIVHHVPRHSPVAASFAVLAAYRYMPADSIIVVVVDPGVGTERDIVCLEVGGRLFLAPDNGALTGLVMREGPGRAFLVRNEHCFITPVSSTFHGRDIFAPVAARLAAGMDASEVGPAVESCRVLDLPAPEVGAESALVEVQWVDGFGNLITNCPGETVSRLAGRWNGVVADLGDVRGVPLVSSYEAVGAGEVLAIVGSCGYLEISVREGDAASALGLGIGSRLSIGRPGG
jgi:hypothetical protein